MGNKKLHNLLFLCAFLECQHNRVCKAIFQRIVVRVKIKVVLIAIANKLLKQVFAIAKSGLSYDENFVLKLT